MGFWLLLIRVKGRLDPIPSPVSNVEPAPVAKDSKYRIKFGYMKRRSDDSYYAYKKTTTIPLKTGRFRFGYTIEASEDEPFTAYAIDYSPDGPMNEGQPRNFGVKS